MKITVKDTSNQKSTPITVKCTYQGKPGRAQWISGNYSRNIPQQGDYCLVTFNDGEQLILTRSEATRLVVYL